MPRLYVSSAAAARTAKFVRRRRELKTIDAMLDLYCRHHHQSDNGRLCSKCGELRSYARRRLERCVFGEEKPTCAKCTVHCYKAGMRERIRGVMQWASPRMLWRRPLLTIRHMIDGRRVAPTLQRAV